MYILIQRMMRWEGLHSNSDATKFIVSHQRQNFSELRQRQPSFVYTSTHVFRFSLSFKSLVSPSGLQALTSSSSEFLQWLKKRPHQPNVKMYSSDVTTKFVSSARWSPAIQIYIIYTVRMQPTKWQCLQRGFLVSIDSQFRPTAQSYKGWSRPAIN